MLVSVNKDGRVTLQAIANQFSISKASVHQILHEKIGMSKVRARWVPKQLTEDQKTLFVCLEVLPPSQPNGAMLSAVSLPNHTFTGQA